jgi:iron complex outermembrane receptor protein
VKYFVACMSLLALFVVPEVSFAAEGEGGYAIEELVVTARRREETAQDVPIPITAVTGQELEDRVAFSMRDLERITPNLSLRNSVVAKNSANIFLRGIGQVNWGPAQDPKVGTYVNGVYMGRPQGGLFDLLDIQRVEVLRGPQGTLFGRNTTAGLIHVITREPNHEFDAMARIGGGNDGQLVAAGMINGALTDRFAVRAAVQHRESDGYIKNAYDGTLWNDENRSSARVTALWTPADNFEAVASFDYQKIDELPSLGTCRFVGPENGATAGGLEGIAWFFGTYDDVRDNCRAQTRYVGYEDDPDNNSTIDSGGLSLTLRWETGIGEFTSVSSVREMDENNGSWGFLSDSTAGNVLEIQQPAGTTNEFSQWSQEFRLAGTAFDDNLDWVAGIYAFSEDARQHFGVPLFRNMVAPDCADVPQFCIDIGGGLTLGMIALGVQYGASNNLNYDATNESQAVFAEGTYRFNDRLSLTAGIRYTEDDRALSLTQTLLDNSPDLGLRCPDGSIPVADKCSRTAPTQDETTPRLILSYKVNDDVMIYGGWSKGYSSGGLNQTPRLEAYLPETSENWEFGFKSDLLDNRLRLNMTTFYNTYKNQQQSVGRIIDNQPVVAILNAQEATLYGVEADLVYAPGRGWTFTGTYGYVHGEYDEFNVRDVEFGPPPQLVETVVLRDISDTDVIRGSPYTYSLSVAKQMFFDSGDSVVAHLGWAYRGRQFFNLDSHPSSRQAKYGLADARITWAWRNGKTAMSFWSNNLLDREYTYSKGGDDNAVFSREYWNQPVRYGLELVHSLGG